MASIQKVDLVDIDLNTGNIHRSFFSHAIGLKDNKGDAFGVRVFRDGEAVDLTGASVQGVFMPPQGSPIAITSGNSVSGNEAYVVLPQACYDYEGQFTLAIKLVGGGVTGTMRIVDGIVSNTHASGTVSPTSAVPTYQEILSTYDDMVAATAAANGAIAATYSSSSTYKVGDYCIHDGGLYRCTTAITTAEVWTSGHWTAAKIAPDLSDLKSAFPAASGTEIVDFTKGRYPVNINNNTIDISSPISADAVACALVPCLENDIFIVQITGANGAYNRAYAFTDESGNVIEIVTSSEGVEYNEIIIAPQNAKYAVFNAQIAKKHVICKGYSANEKANSIEKGKNVIDGVQTIVFGTGRYPTTNNNTHIDISTPIPAPAVYCALVPCESGDQFKLYAKAPVGAYNRVWAFTDATGNVLLTDATIPSGSNVNTVLIAPIGAKYAVFNVSKTDDFYACKGLPVAVRVSSLESNMEKVIPKSLDYTLIDGYYIRYADGTTNQSVDFCYTDYIDISQFDDIVYKQITVSISTAQHGMAFYNANKEYISGVRSIGNASGRGYEYNKVEVPDGAVYARFSWWISGAAPNAGSFEVFDAAEYDKSITGIVYELEKKPSGVNVAAVHEVPQSEGVQNAILTAHQFTDILWTPLADMPGINRDPATQAISYKTHKKGCRQKGIPYGSGLPFNQQVNGSIAFDAFATAVKTAGSVLYTNNMYDDNKMASYYGISCSKLVQACWGAPQIYDSQNIFDMPGLVKIADPGQYTVDDIQLGDGVLNPSVHCTICTDILRDTKGNVVGIEISESVMPTCRRLVWSVNEFYEHFATYGLYRYSLISNAKYHKARYIDLDDGYEGVNDIPIGIKRGSFINMSTSNAYRAFVDNTKWTTLHDIVNGVEQTSPISSNDIYLPKDRLGYHEIYPTDANGNRGNSSFYFVYSITASATVDSEIATISYAVTENMKPIAVRFGAYFYELVEGDVGTGTVEVEVPSGSTSCSVLFENDYGVVFSNSIPLT